KNTRREFLKKTAMASAVLSLPSYMQSSFASSSQPADFIFKGGSILTMNGGNQQAEALAVLGGRLVAVGNLDEVNVFKGKNTQIVDLDGRTLMPGLIEPHFHTAPVMFDDWVDISPITVDTFDAVMKKLKDAAKNLKEGDWLLASGFDSSVTKGGRIFTLEDMNSIAPNNPFFLIEGSGHVAYANTLAYQKAGITRDTPNPTAGRFMKGPDGELNGRIEEVNAFGKVIAAIPPVTDTPQRLQRLFKRCSSVGVTSGQDMSVGVFNGMDELTELEKAVKDSAQMRLRGFLVSTEYDVWKANGIKPGDGDDVFRLIGMKAWSDGSTQAYSAYQRENYIGKDSRGHLNYTKEQLKKVLSRCHNDGWQCAVHSNGDAAIDMTLEAYEEVLKENPRADHRHRIDHCSVGHPEHFSKMNELGVSPTFLIGHVRWWGKAFKDRILGPDRVRYYDACKTAVENNLRYTIHSDWNVTPINPLRCAQDAVTRVMHEGGGVFVPEERVPVEAALRAITIDAAWQLRMDDIVGSLERGKYADMVILEDNPTTIDPMKLEKIKVSETWLEGKKVYKS
ncbi:MAG: amidohydrolase, partial [Gammaproteobacteria bacterium]|nr:amidohydrolase [Gammaproteobacteria bacterium]